MPKMPLKKIDDQNFVSESKTMLRNIFVVSSMLSLELEHFNG